MNFILILILGSLSSFIVTYILTPFIRNFSIKKGLLDIPNDRKDHKIPIVRLGGVSIFSGFIISNSVFFIISKLDGDSILDSKLFFTIIIGSIIFFLIGLAEDLLENIDPFLRLFIQFAFTFLIWSQGLRINGISLDIFGNSYNNLIFSDFISIIFTSIFIVGIVNALNWIDGLDGLAGGISIISLTTMTFIISPSYIFLAFSLIGSCAAFLRFNSHPASIIMGDSGSYLLGFSLASLSIIYSSSSNTQNLPGIVNLVAIVFLLFIPLIDMVRVIFTRIINGFSPFYPDKIHFHHVLRDKGFNYKKIIFIFYFFSIITCMMASMLVSQT
ncbi:Undecaprenyl-phosphate N-acetylglucosaminyl 1-phosphate transferase [Prochlorococcus marinus str. MIT 9116]|uniref:Undecaprenyl-phosphate N-acetylglucosaminyl 1-phosphate transferase n=1 Tax=Prochlorococcus marinus str. MIT 9116 TaxID=167544 RepID=A0A0A1ZUL3_PROMR|nr:Undecaprenyl-phosphate N-acetylglucosaminyl 1-phosphate transferase [Prochlorococcus marinus str. MIT 9116]